MAPECKAGYAAVHIGDGAETSHERMGIGRGLAPLLLTPVVMDTFDSIELTRGVIAALDALTALVWATIAQSIWRARGTARPQGTLMHLVRIMSALMAIHFGLHVVLDLVPFQDDGWFYLVMCQLTLASMVPVLPILRHMVPLGSIGEKSPGRLWLAINYGSAAAVLILSGLTGPHVNLDKIYLSLMTALILWRMADLRFGGFLVLAFILAVGVVATVLTETPPSELSPGSSGSRAFLSLALAVPFAMRILGEVVRRFLVNAVKLGAAAAVYIGARMLAQVLPTSQLSLLLGFGGALALVWVLGSGGLWLCAVVDRLVLRRSHLWGQHLQAFVRTLTPELGVEECCRRSVDELVRELAVRGGAVLLDADPYRGERWTSGHLDLEAIVQVWPEGSEKLPTGAFDSPTCASPRADRHCRQRRQARDLRELRPPARPGARDRRLAGPGRIGGARARPGREDGRPGRDRGPHRLHCSPTSPPHPRTSELSARARTPGAARRLDRGRPRAVLPVRGPRGRPRPRAGGRGRGRSRALPPSGRQPGVERRRCPRRDAASAPARGLGRLVERPRRDHRRRLGQRSARGALAASSRSAPPSTSRASRTTTRGPASTRRRRSATAASSTSSRGSASTPGCSSSWRTATSR